MNTGLFLSVDLDDARVGGPNPTVSIVVAPKIVGTAKRFKTVHDQARLAAMHVHVQQDRRCTKGNVNAIKLAFSNFNVVQVQIHAAVAPKTTPIGVFNGEMAERNVFFTGFVPLYDHFAENDAFVGPFANDLQWKIKHQAARFDQRFTYDDGGGLAPRSFGQLQCLWQRHFNRHMDRAWKFCSIFGGWALRASSSGRGGGGGRSAPVSKGNALLGRV